MGSTGVWANRGGCLSGDGRQHLLPISAGLAPGLRCRGCPDRPLDRCCPASLSRQGGETLLDVEPNGDTTRHDGGTDRHSD